MNNEMLNILKAIQSNIKESMSVPEDMVKEIILKFLKSLDEKNKLLEQDKLKLNEKQYGEIIEIMIP